MQHQKLSSYGSYYNHVLELDSIWFLLKLCIKFSKYATACMSWFQYLWVGLKQTKHSKEQKGTSKLIDNGGGISWSIKS